MSDKKKRGKAAAKPRAAPAAKPDKPLSYDDAKNDLIVHMGETWINRFEIRVRCQHRDGMQAVRPRPAPYRIIDCNLQYLVLFRLSVLFEI